MRGEPLTTLQECPRSRIKPRGRNEYRPTKKTAAHPDSGCAAVIHGRLQLFVQEVFRPSLPESRGFRLPAGPDPPSVALSRIISRTHPTPTRLLEHRREERPRPTRDRYRRHDILQGKSHRAGLVERHPAQILTPTQTAFQRRVLRPRGRARREGEGATLEIGMPVKSRTVGRSRARGSRPFPRRDTAPHRGRRPAASGDSARAPRAAHTRGVGVAAARNDSQPQRRPTPSPTAMRAISPIVRPCSTGIGSAPDARTFVLHVEQRPLRPCRR